MDEKNEISSIMNNLIESLKSSGKNETAQYFEKIQKKIIKREIIICNRHLKEFLKSGAIVQYADFTDEQERIYRQIYKYIDKISSR